MSELQAWDDGESGVRHPGVAPTCAELLYRPETLNPKPPTQTPDASRSASRRSAGGILLTPTNIPHGGVRSLHQKPAYLAQSTSGPDVVQIWSRGRSGTTAEVECDILGSRGALKFISLQASQHDFQTGRQDSFQVFFFFSIALEPRMGDTQVHEPSIRALFGTASHFCEVVVLASNFQMGRQFSLQARHPSYASVYLIIQSSCTATNFVSCLFHLFL